jgi:hypothetical protein
MFKMTITFKRIALVALILATGLAAVPAIGVSAADPNSQAILEQDYPRLSNIWAREQRIYQREGERLANADSLITKVQTLIDKANQKGWDTSSVQAALNAFSAAIPTAQASHYPGAAIISSHAGFDSDGKVIDRASAIATIRSLAQVLKDTRAAMNGIGKSLHEAIRAFREANPRPTTTPGS